MHSRGAGYVISSAVVAVLPGRMEAVASQVSALPGAEIAARGNGKLVILLEGATSGEVGGLLAQIGVLEGVISAAMVYEHNEPHDPAGAEA